MARGTPSIKRRPVASLKPNIKRGMPILVSRSICAEHHDYIFIIHVDKLVGAPKALYFSRSGAFLLLSKVIFIPIACLLSRP